MRFRWTSAFLAASLLLFIAMPASPQQPPQPAGGRGGRGGGFTQPEPINFNDHEGWTNIFDGTAATFANWDGNAEVWRLENGTVWAESTCEKSTGTTYLIWKGGEPADFELKVEMKLEPNVNSGFQYRSFRSQGRGGGGGPGGRGGGGGPGGRGGQTGPCPSGQPRGSITAPPGRNWNLGGSQFDFNYGNNYSGQVYEGGTSRGIIAYRGQVVRTETGKKARLIASVGDPPALGGYVKINDWNQVHIIARGNILIHVLNGHVMAVLVDDDPAIFKAKGLLGMQIEGMGKVSYRNMWLKTL